jgi:DNA-3-methyladenine glycosylase
MAGAPQHQSKADIHQTTRIGINQGVEIPWRWYIKDHPAVSKK